MTRRRKSSSNSVLLDIAVKLPLWANVLIAFGLFTGLHLYAGDQPPVFSPVTPGQIGPAFSGYLPKMLAFYGQYVFPPIFVLGGCLGLLRRRALAKQFTRVSSASDIGDAIRSLSWAEFEKLIEEALRRQGYAVTPTKSGPDGGVDLVLRKGDERFLVQCKQWKAYKVSVQVVRELYGVMAAEGVAGGFVVTSGAFTAEARKFSQGLNIQLIDGRSLISWFNLKHGK